MPLPRRERPERERTVTTEKNCDIGLLRKVLLSRGRPIGFTTKLMLQIYKNNTHLIAKRRHFGGGNVWRGGRIWVILPLDCNN